MRSANRRTGFKPFLLRGLIRRNRQKQRDFQDFDFLLAVWQAGSLFN
jgi:hypothetical protein